ncbi:UNVERIFIED_CONTAM: hypothetical protein Slati_3832200 [Sesamum latifolium]|uniref:Uncharacterized protein n=1 Tax=Sesamum latifolium TaxID=2727402 RepID=A0AAW2TLU3_9LAMI
MNISSPSQWDCRPRTPRPADPLTEPPYHSTSSNTSSRGQPPQKASPAPRRA